MADLQWICRECGYGNREKGRETCLNCEEPKPQATKSADLLRSDDTPGSVCEMAYIIIEMKHDLEGMQGWVVPAPVERLLKKIVEWIEKQEKGKPD